jgi:preprotein translocase subunit SecG
MSKKILISFIIILMAGAALWYSWQAGLLPMSSSAPKQSAVQEYKMTRDSLNALDLEIRNTQDARSLTILKEKQKYFWQRIARQQKELAQSNSGFKSSLPDTFNTSSDLKQLLVRSLSITAAVLFVFILLLLRLLKKKKTKAAEDAASMTEKLVSLRRKQDAQSSSAYTTGKQGRFDNNQYHPKVDPALRARAKELATQKVAVLKEKNQEESKTEAEFPPNNPAHNNPAHSSYNSPYSSETDTDTGAIDVFEQTAHSESPRTSEMDVVERPGSAPQSQLPQDVLQGLSDALETLQGSRSDNNAPASTKAPQREQGEQNSQGQELKAVARKRRTPGAGVKSGSSLKSTQELEQILQERKERGESPIPEAPQNSRFEEEAEQKESVLKLARRGYTSSEIARRLRMAQDQVELIVRLNREH